MYCIILQCIVLYCSVLYCTALHYTVLCCNALCCFALHRARVQGGGGPRGLDPPLEIEKQKKKIIRANFRLFHLSFATFSVENIMFSARSPPKKKKRFSDIGPPPPYEFLDTRLCTALRCTVLFVQLLKKSCTIIIIAKPKSNCAYIFNKLYTI